MRKGRLKRKVVCRVNFMVTYWLLEQKGSFGVFYKCIQSIPRITICTYPFISAYFARISGVLSRFWRHQSRVPRRGTRSLKEPSNPMRNVACPGYAESKKRQWWRSCFHVWKGANARGTYVMTAKWRFFSSRKVQLNVVSFCNFQIQFYSSNLHPFKKYQLSSIFSFETYDPILDSYYSSFFFLWSK